MGLTTAASQQHSLLLHTQDSVIHPRRAFRRDFQQYLIECKNAGHELLVMGDFNEVIGEAADGMIAVMQSVGLIDIMRRQHVQNLPPTYARGKKCLDYVLGTQLVAEAVCKAGYEPFNARFTTDHRSYFIDLSIKKLFGMPLQPLSALEPRILKSNNLQQVTAYIRKKYQILQQHNVFRRVERLLSLGNRHSFAERLDRDVVEASLAAEKSIRRYGEPQWSVELHRARKKVQVLKKCLSMAKTQIDNEERIRIEWMTLHDTEEPPRNEQECIQQLRRSEQEVRKIVNGSFERRVQERLRRIQELQTSGSASDRNQARVLRQIHSAEAKNRVYAKLRSLRMVNERTGVSRIEIPLHPDQDPKTCSEWQQIDVPTVVLEQLRSQNQKHFGQAAGTPFTVPPLSHQLGYRGDGEFADQILTGNYQYPAGLTDNVRKFLYHLRITDELAQLQVFPTIDEKDYVGKLKAWRESTVTSPSRMHLGHYKAMISKHLYSQIPEVESDEHKAFREELDFKQSEILRVHLLLMNYALERGYSYQRWQTVANSVLFKEPGNIRIHRTRIIHIYEADYNLMLGLKWRSALLQAEALAQLNSGQFGSRPKHNATDPVFVEELQLELSRITRKTLALTNYDATACYDRIIPNFAMIASRKFGVPATVTHSNARTLEQTDYRIRTDVGLATEGYQHSEDYPIYGTGQGSGNSPVIWCFISSILYDCYEELASTAQYRTPDNQRKMELGMIGYVDDSNGQTNCFDDIETTATALEVLHTMQKNANIWSQLLSVSGGALELTKCSYHIVHWKFATSGAPVLCNDREQFGGVAVSDVITGESYELQYLAPYEAHKTLDHYKEPSGIQTTQYRKLWEKSNALTSFLWSNHITREEAWIFYFSTYLPSVSYPLANSHFTESQLTKLQKRAMNILFAKCGFNRNTKREVLFGPLDLGGADFRRLYDQQGIGQIITFLRHWRTRTLVGDLLRMVLEWCNYAAGLSVSILENTSCKLPHLESKSIDSG